MKAYYKKQISVPKRKRKFLGKKICGLAILVTLQMAEGGRIPLSKEATEKYNLSWALLNITGKQKREFLELCLYCSRKKKVTQEPSPTAIKLI